ncbi:ComEC/Rec2 family competence protein [uncultured Roseibium sp.]|uniref:ComEC/Rec2 family competence protein n=1 Tax=uncultured Roseibium sp. TaxID=1936171 RepID=UPI00262E9226|nr:ComEC/Rec2 family competence protein [uncultured Roseibium sp.]
MQKEVGRKNGANSEDYIGHPTSDDPAVKTRRLSGRKQLWSTNSNAAEGGKASAANSQWENRALLWISFSYAAGIGIYAALPEEPSWFLLSCLFTGIVIFTVWHARRRHLSPVMLLVLACFAGLTSASLRTAYVDSPRIGEDMNVSLTGKVLEATNRPNGKRLVIEVETVNDRALSEIVFPAKVRLRVPGETQAGVGDRINTRARVFPPAGPVVPGGYDFSFRAYFLELGATGFSFGQPDVLPAKNAASFQNTGVWIQALRDRIASRIRASLPDSQEAALVVALLVGDRSSINETQQENLRAAGLAHILAISGLHMALFAGGTYAAALFIFALFPPLALRFPIHKFAAGAAMAAAFFYLLVSGASVATQRSFLMISLVFLGILVGRRGLTVRSVAFAGLLLLVLAPERLFYPGFQMSFAAVICLVAVYETWRERVAPLAAGRRYRKSLLDKITLSAARWMAGLLVTALVAGVATGIIAAHHFGRIAPYGLIGNMLGMPVFTLLVMPMGVLSLLLMPLGLSAVPLAVMSFGLTLLLEIAAFVAELDGGIGAIGQLTMAETLAFTSALFAVLLLRGKWRLGAVLPLLAGSILVYLSPAPDIQISATGSRIAARDISGNLNWNGVRGSFQTDIWYQAEGLTGEAIMSRKMQSPQRECDPLGCVIKAFEKSPVETEAATPDRPFYIALPKSLDALVMDCRYADLIVSDLIVPGTCEAGLVIDRDIRERRGAISLWLSRQAGSDPSADENSQLTFLREKDTGRLQIDAIQYAIPIIPRPWHRKGEVTRASLR